MALRGRYQAFTYVYIHYYRMMKLSGCSFIRTKYDCHPVSQERSIDINRKRYRRLIRLALNFSISERLVVCPDEKFSKNLSKKYIHIDSVTEFLHIKLDRTVR